MTTAFTRTPALARRWPMPWDNATPAPMLSPQLLHKPRVLEMHMRYTTGISITPQSTLDIARNKAAALTPAEVAHIMTNPRQAADALAAGRGTRLQWACLCTALNVSRAIEDGGVVRGLAAHLDDIERALNAVGTRAGDTATPPTWTAPALWATERDAVRLLVNLHAQQLRQLSYLEYQTAWRLAVARVQSCGGEVTNTDALKGLAE